MRTPCIPACPLVIVFCIITLVIHKYLNTETNLGYSSSDQADLKYLWFQQWKLLLYFYGAITEHLPSMFCFIFFLSMQKSLGSGEDVLCCLVWVSQISVLEGTRSADSVFSASTSGWGECRGTAAAPEPSLVGTWGFWKEFPCLLLRLTKKGKSSSFYLSVSPALPQAVPPVSSLPSSCARQRCCWRCYLLT